MSTRALGETAAVAVLAILLTILLTWPMAFTVATASRIDTGDGQQSIWTVAWVARTLLVDPAHLYDANIYYPHRGTLAWLEANIGAGVLAIPVWVASHNAIFAYNWVVLLSFVLAFVAMWALVRHLTGDRIAAVVGAVLFAFTPYSFSHIPHIQLLMTAVLPLSLLAMHRYIEQPTAGRGSALGLALAAAPLSCGYYGIFVGLMVGFGMLFFAVSRGSWRSWRYWVWAVLAAALSIVIVLPFFVPYMQLRADTGFARSLNDSLQWAATWSSYLASPAVAHRWWLRWLPQWKEVLFPGFLAIVLGAAGIVMVFTRNSGADPGPVVSEPATEIRTGSVLIARDSAIFYLLLLGTSFWSSFGPKAGLYSLFYLVVPFFTWLRAPARLGIIVALTLAIFSAVAASRLLRGQRQPWLAAVALVGLAVAELAPIPLRMFERRPEPAAYVTLSRFPYGPVAEFPFFWLRMDYSRHAFYMMNSAWHWKPLVNGYADYIPPDFRQIALPLSSFPNDKSFAILKERHTRYVIFHLNLYNRRAKADLLERLDRYQSCLRPMRLEEDVWLYEIVAWPH